MQLIHVESLSRNFQQGEFVVQALKEISFDVGEGEFTALVGPSGSGKSTLLNCIGALDRPTSGRIFLDGSALDSLKSNQLSDFRLYKIGFVFQAYNLIPVLTAYENVEYILVLQGVEKSERRQRVKSIFEEMDMKDLLDRFPRQLSGGQQQRVAVARALVSHPRVVLADEPTANLDGKNADLLLSIMEEMCRLKNTTFLFSTHDERVMKRAKRLIHLSDGVIESDHGVK